MHLMTVAKGLETPATRYAYPCVLCAAARQINDSVAGRLLRASEAFQQTDYDNTPAFDAVVEELAAAEDAFLEAHSNTEVRL